MSTLEGTTMHPRCRHIGACWDLVQVEHKSKFNFELKKKKTSQNSISNFFKSNFYDSLCCSILEDLSIDVSIANVELILTKLRWFQLFVKSQNSNFELIWKKKSNFGVSKL